MTVHCLVCSSPSQTHRVSLSKTSIFLHHLNFNLQEKVWVFYHSLNISCLLPLFSWILSFWGDLRYMMIWIWVGFILLGLIEWILLVMMLDSHAFLVVSQNFLGTVFDIFIAFLHQKHLLILSTKIYRSNIKVFNIKIKNHNNARNLENITLIPLGINFIKVF